MENEEWGNPLHELSVNAVVSFPNITFVTFITFITFVTFVTFITFLFLAKTLKASFPCNPYFSSIKSFPFHFED